MSLTGIRVLDLSRMLPGPYCSMILADLGAKVIRVDDPSFPFTSPPPYLKRESYYESSFNSILMRNKKSIALNLKKDGALDVFYNLIQHSDVMIESFRPGVAKRLKIDYETLKKINDKLIYCSISGYGQTGPYSQIAGHDLNYLAVTGNLGLNTKRYNHNKPDEVKKPIVPCIQSADLSGSFYGAIGILAAIIEQLKNPENDGQYIDISITDCAFTLNPYHAAMVFAEYDDDILQGDFPFYNTYKTKDDKFLSIGAIEPKFWNNLCKALNLDQDSQSKQMSRGADRESLFNTLGKKFLERTQKDWMNYLKDFDIPIMPVNDFTEACKDSHLIDRDMIIEKKHERLGIVKHINSPIKMSRTPGEIRYNAFKKGKNTKEILKQMGYSEEEIKKLKRKRIFR
ncbi:MAG: CoA transferase [Candidatus Lokiarchaeota archaeon]|nr:CoA transferase [Candidatus Lokiarchaeota archaeon]